MEPRLKHSIA